MNFIGKSSFPTNNFYDTFMKLEKPYSRKVEKEIKYLFNPSNQQDLQNIKSWLNKKMGKGYEPSNFTVEKLTVEFLKDVAVIKNKAEKTLQVQKLDDLSESQQLKNDFENLQTACAILNAMTYRKHDPTSAAIGTFKIFLCWAIFFLQSIENIWTKEEDTKQEDTAFGQGRMWAKCVISGLLALGRFYHAYEACVEEKNKKKAIGEGCKAVLEVVTTILPVLTKITHVPDENWANFCESIALLIDFLIEYYDLKTKEDVIVLKDIKDAYGLLQVKPNAEGFFEGNIVTLENNIDKRVKDWKTKLKAEYQEDRMLSEYQLRQGCYAAIEMIAKYNQKYEAELTQVEAILETLKNKCRNKSITAGLDANLKYADKVKIFCLKLLSSKGLKQKAFDERYNMLTTHLGKAPLPNRIKDKLAELNTDATRVKALLAQLKADIYAYADSNYKAVWVQKDAGQDGSSSVLRKVSESVWRKISGLFSRTKQNAYGNIPSNNQPSNNQPSNNQPLNNQNLDNKDERGFSLQEQKVNDPKNQSNNNGVIPLPENQQKEKQNQQQNQQNNKIQNVSNTHSVIIPISGVENNLGEHLLANQNLESQQ